MNPSVCFFTVAYYKDYDFLLGAIEHHAKMGKHLILDTSPPEHAVKFNRLPSTVLWMHEPFYGAGWKNFRLKTAVQHAMEYARMFESDILMYLDADEFVTPDAAALLFPWAERAMVEVQATHWKRDGRAYTFGPSEWHSRLWPAKSHVEIAENKAWQAHPKFNGNREHHPVPVPSQGLQVIRVYGEFVQHLHYALGDKAFDEETAQNTIDGWPNGTPTHTPPLPERLRVWKEEGKRPSEAFK